MKNIASFSLWYQYSSKRGLKFLSSANFSGFSLSLLFIILLFFAPILSATTVFGQPVQPYQRLSQINPYSPGLNILPDLNEPIDDKQIVLPNRSSGLPALDKSFGKISLTAKLTDNGKTLNKGLRWSVNKAAPDNDGGFPLIRKINGTDSLIALPAGEYIITAVYGNAYLSKKIEIAASEEKQIPFILHAGGLIVDAIQTGQGAIEATNVKISLYSNERDQDGQRLLVMDTIPLGQIIRLNAGLYHLVSKFGPHNASERADLTVEAGQLTKATMLHAAGRVLVKLVNRAGGEALPGTRWEIRLPDGQVIGKSVGAVPTFILKAGVYHVIAVHDGKTFRRQFTLPTGITAELEIDISEKDTTSASLPDIPGITTSK